MHSRLRTPRYRLSIVNKGGAGKGETALSDTDVVLEIQRFLRDIFITHVEVDRLNFAPRALFLGQMVRYLILANEGQIPVGVVVVVGFGW